MSVDARNSFFPSPAQPGLARVANFLAQVGQARLAMGEGAERTRSVSAAGEGFLAGYPSPGRSLHSRPPSPPRGEGKASAS